MAGTRLGYLVFEVRKPLEWSRFLQATLGLPGPIRNEDGSDGYRLDEAGQRLIVVEGKADDLQALGLEFTDDATLDRALESIGRAGIRVEPADDALRACRRVGRLHVLHDLAGNRVELCVGLELSGLPFRSERFPSGFRVGDAGIGHAVLNSSQPEAMERFYVDVLGFAVTERLATRVGPLAVTGTFLHCNRRHHSIALFDLPIGKRLHHFMLQANALRDVGACHEAAGRSGLPMSLGLGQHPDPDGTFSFYGVTPSGFDFEIGADSKEIEPLGWQPLHTDVTSAWGHRPSLRLQLKMAGGILQRMLRRSVPARFKAPSRPYRAAAAQEPLPAGDRFPSAGLR